MIDNLILLWLAALPLMGSPGPATLSIAGIGAAFGFRKGLPYLAGICSGTFTVLVMIASGVTALVLAEPALVTGLGVLAGAYILYLAWRIATAPVGRLQARTDRTPAYFPALALALSNPKAYAAIGAVYSGQTVIPDDLAGDAVAKVAGLTLVILAVNPIWLAFGAAFSRFLSDPRIGRVANIAFAVMLVASVALALLGA